MELTIAEMHIVNDVDYKNKDRCTYLCCPLLQFLCREKSLFLLCVVPADAPSDVAVYKDYNNDTVRVNWSLPVLCFHSLLILTAMLLL